MKNEIVIFGEEPKEDRSDKKNIFGDFKTKQKAYEKYYSEKSFQGKLKKYTKKAGAYGVYLPKLLYNTLKSPSTPVSNKVMIVAGLGYFICPIDAISDLLPVIGLTDDITVMGMVVNNLTNSITKNIVEDTMYEVSEIFDTDMEEIEILIKSKEKEEKE